MVQADMKGFKYGRLLVLEHYKGATRIGARATCRCMCDCGTEIVTRSYELLRGHTRSCGCLQRDMARALAGIPMPLGSRTEAGENNGHAKVWCIKKAGKEYSFTNLIHFVRTHKDLFEADDVKPYKHREDKCRAAVRLGQLFLTRKDGMPQISQSNWKGWTPVDKKEDQ